MPDDRKRPLNKHQDNRNHLEKRRYFPPQSNLNRQLTMNHKNEQRSDQENHIPADHRHNKPQGKFYRRQNFPNFTKANERADQKQFIGQRIKDSAGLSFLMPGTGNVSVKDIGNDGKKKNS